MFRLFSLVIIGLSIVGCKKQTFEGDLSLPQGTFVVRTSEKAKVSLVPGPATVEFKGGEGKVVVRLTAKTETGKTEKITLKSKRATVDSEGRVVVSAAEIGQSWGLVLEVTNTVLKTETVTDRVSCRSSFDDNTGRKDTGVQYVTYKKTYVQRDLSAEAVNSDGVTLARYEGQRNDEEYEYVSSTPCRNGGIIIPINPTYY